MVFGFKKIWWCYPFWLWFRLERLLIYLTGIENIRDVIPFPRTPNSCEF